jgi:hypothetical protein
VADLIGANRKMIEEVLVRLRSFEANREPPGQPHEPPPNRQGSHHA